MDSFIDFSKEDLKDYYELYDLSLIALDNKEFRKMIGIKKGFFS